MTLVKFVNTGALTSVVLSAFRDARCGRRLLFDIINSALVPFTTAITQRLRAIVAVTTANRDGPDAISSRSSESITHPFTEYAQDGYLLAFNRFCSVMSK